MVKSSRPTDEEGPPRSFPEVAPARDLHATSDIRFVMIEVAKYGERIERLTKDVEKLGDKFSADMEKHNGKISQLEKAVDRVKTGAYVVAAVLSVVGIVIWWAVGERITTAVHSGLGSPPQVQQNVPAK